ncbi:unnamed protein product [Nezara viridula]|uniref:TATA-binding protein-associated factor 172 n=1 Tax=Nezara viridula TaxID=85310 RepID=A0A9P0MDU1_NEZVI|nr:unnamed protein product [Nezara viridula]
MASSRLDRLFLLLESGSSAVTRRAAANQLGEVQRLHPHELHNLLKSVLTYLKSTSWDTRIAAGWAVEAILKKVPLWDPIGVSNEKDVNGSIDVTELTGRLTCSNFNVDNILENSAHLMGSEGREYETSLQNAANTKEDLEKQRNVLNERLNLTAAAELGFDTSSLYTIDDLKVEIVNTNDVPVKPNIGEVVGLSCREVNRARRKARQAMLKQRSKEKMGSYQQSDEDEEPEKKKIKLESSTDEEVSYPVPDNTNNWPIDTVEWPLDWFCQQLAENLFSPTWEIRHGAGTALKHLIKNHGRSGGKSTKINQSQMQAVHESWLIDVALRLVCVLTLDRFGDFVFDQVVAPVRETSAQVLGSVANLMNHQSVHDILKVLLKLLEQKDWETRHGGLLGIKYIFAVRQDLLVELFPLCFPKLHTALKDAMDDVGAVAAGALATSVDLMASKFPEQAVDVLNTLCLLVPELDDLTPASNTFVPLLAQLLLKQNVSSRISADTAVSELVMRVWSLLEHNNTSVRSAALNTLSSLTGHASFAALLQPTLRYLYQRALLEHHQATHDNVHVVWKEVLEKSKLNDILVAACPYITGWLCLAMQPPRLPFDPSLLIQTKPISKEGTCPLKSGRCVQGQDPARCDMKQYIGGNETVPVTVREKNSSHARFTVTRMLGYLSKFIVKPAPGIVYTEEMESPIDCYVKVILVYLNSKSALQRFVVGLVVSEWAANEPPSPLMECLTETVYYDEIGLSYSKLLQDVKDFFALLKHYKVVADEITSANVLTLDQMEHLCGTYTADLLEKSRLKPKLLETLEERRKCIRNAVTTTLNEQNTYHIMTQAALAGAIVMLKELPEKLSPIVKPLMDSIKREENEELQELSAKHLALLVENCVERVPCPNAKIITNLITFLRSDTEFTPRISPAKAESCSFNNDKALVPLDDDSLQTSIITLLKQLKNAERAILRRCLSSSGRGPGRPPAMEVQLEDIIKEDNAQKINLIQRRGATLALEAITKRFGQNVPVAVPTLWQAVVGTNNIQYKTTEIEHLIGILQVLEVTCPSVDKSLLPQILKCLNHLVRLLSHPFSAIRHMASRCLAQLASIEPNIVMDVVIEYVIPMLSAVNDDTKRRGSIEAVTVIIEKLQLAVVPYVYFLIVPLLGRMSDQNETIRTLATHTFADLIQVMPLESGIPNPPKLSPRLMVLKNEQRQFVEQLFNPSSITDYKVPVPISAELRSYQQAGVNWLAFLNQYKLHGLLCDDMGLGKTLQSICILAGDHYDRKQKYKETRKADSAPLPSLVVCPPTLTGHWVFEVEKFTSRKYLSALQYAGPPAERERLRKQVKKHNLIVASYDIVRKDIDFFSSIKWNYCILDEGHVIKNGKTKSSKAIKQLIANHRLILSGTPIQNNVLELWSLFDFLMPGFLGTEKQFTARYSRPILMSRDPKSSAKEQEAGVLAMEALHRQVLPFVLRRMKEDVLKDLPPKITQALRYLQSVCNHPKLALNSKHPQYENIIKQLKEQNSSLSDIQHAAKFPALKCHMPTVSYLRLDGSVPASLRHSVVTRFNNDPTIDVLILTTQVGGLGLNLTGADTVIFVEHDWSPMKDLQAMDRAHRIGQKKVVNVYRLITRATLEEKIMGLQKFKLMTANTVISADNASLETMGTDKLLDLFSLEKQGIAGNSSGPSSAGSGGQLKSVLDALPDLWDQADYDEEYDVSNFVNSLRD